MELPPLPRLAVVRKRIEVRLADLEVDDLAALGLQGLGARQHLVGALGGKVGSPIGVRMHFRGHPCG